jgi:phosphatidylglycerophosphatase A
MVRALSPTGLGLLTVGGLGRLKPSGTWGSIPTVLLAAVLIGAGLGPAGGTAGWAVYHIVLLAVVVFFTLACAMVGDAAEAHFDRKDPGAVVADEAAGMAIPLMFLPPAAVATPGLAALTLVYAFIAFRIMDILKPAPADRLQSIPGGWGIVIDDLMAGVYAFAAVQLVLLVML